MNKTSDTRDAAQTGDTETGRIEWHEGDMPYSTRFGDHFYSRQDGRAECGHVFINANRLPERFARGGLLRIAETGFGTGLNFAETWHQWKLTATDGCQLHFTSFEKFPMARSEISRALSHWPEISGEASALVSRWPDQPDEDVLIEFGPVRLEVLIGDAATRIGNWAGQADAWFLDGFAPSRNPDMWSMVLMSAIAAHSAEAATIATYSAAGWVRRNLQAAGFTVEKRPGFAGKREMTLGWLGDGAPV